LSFEWPVRGIKTRSPAVAKIATSSCKKTVKKLLLVVSGLRGHTRSMIFILFERVYTTSY